MAQGPGIALPAPLLVAEHSAFRRAVTGQPVIGSLPNQRQIFSVCEGAVL
jgi:hypothetical protein